MLLIPQGCGLLLLVLICVIAAHLITDADVVEEELGMEKGTGPLSKLYNFGKVRIFFIKMTILYF